MKSENLPPEFIKALLKWLGYDGVAFFEMCLDEYQTLCACWDVPLPGIQKHSPAKKAVKLGPGQYTIPHSVHFREGMAVRNFMRKSGFFKDFNSYDFDNYWEEAVLAALDVCHRNKDSETRK